MHAIGGKAGARMVRVHYYNNLAPSELAATDPERADSEELADFRASTRILNTWHTGYGHGVEVLQHEVSDEVELTRLLKQAQEYGCVTLRLGPEILDDLVGSRLLYHLRPGEDIQLRDSSNFGCTVRLSFVSRQLYRTKTPIGEYEDHFAYFRVDSVLSLAQMPVGGGGSLEDDASDVPAPPRDDTDVHAVSNPLVFDRRAAVGPARTGSGSGGSGGPVRTSSREEESWDRKYMCTPDGGWERNSSSA